MSRKGKTPKRNVLPDPKYQEKLITKFTNALMYGGKKSVAETIFYGALDTVAEKVKDDPVKTLKKAIYNVKPIIEVRSRRVGGANYQVPMEVRPDRRTSLAIRWIIEASRGRTDRSMMKKLAAEIVDAAEEKGGAIKLRDDVHKMAEANKAFAHYRW